MRVRDPKTGKTFFAERRRRYDVDCSPRELTFCSFRRYRFLTTERTRTWFAEALRQQRRQWPIDPWAYAIMPEHVHLLLAPRMPGVKVGSFAGSVKEQVARKAISWLTEHAPEWISKTSVIEGNKTRRRFW